MSQGPPDIPVVEDEGLIQDLVEDVLSEGGFRVTTVPSDEEAVTALRGNANIYPALVTDIGLNGKMDGWEVAKQVHEVDPDFPVGENLQRQQHGDQNEVGQLLLDVVSLRLLSLGKRRVRCSQTVLPKCRSRSTEGIRRNLL